MAFTNRDLALVEPWTFTRGSWRAYSTGSSPARGTGEEIDVGSTPGLEKGEPQKDLYLIGADVAGEAREADSAPSQKKGASSQTTQSRSEGPPSLLEIAKAGTSLKPRDGPAVTSVSGKVVQMELRWLKDPRALADRVARMLRSGNIALAADLVRTAQRQKMECSVAWNHLMSYSMEQGEPLAAFKFYNDVSISGTRYAVILTLVNRICR